MDLALKRLMTLLWLHWTSSTKFYLFQYCISSGNEIFFLHFFSGAWLILVPFSFDVYKKIHCLFVSDISLITRTTYLILWFIFTFLIFRRYIFKISHVVLITRNFFTVDCFIFEQYIFDETSYIFISLLILFSFK